MSDSHVNILGVNTVHVTGIQAASFEVCALCHNGK